MALGCIGFLRVMFMPVSGLMGNVMGVEYILARTGAGMSGSSSGVLNMVLVIIISGKGAIFVLDIWFWICISISMFVYVIKIDACYSGFDAWIE